jgi:hypothetical protein
VYYNALLGICKADSYAAISTPAREADKSK